jgi:hypothetical protein
MDRAADVAEAVERRNPRVIRALLALRWGGLRTIRPDRRTWAAVVAAGSLTGLAVRGLVGRVLGRRPPAGFAVVAGWAVAWTALWRWDTVRFRRRRVVLTLELTAEVLDELTNRLRADGVAVERWDGPTTVGGRRRGLVCAVRDVRRVNAAIDEHLGATAGSAGPSRGLAQP